MLSISIKFATLAAAASAVVAAAASCTSCFAPSTLPRPLSHSLLHARLVRADSGA